ncbi:hypothetical protein LZ32DRAFT_181976 [Colletotrichum eremochloae]|nr:hypothetical protein LZ32DRAFT_181976 [Colletotrichum eremochloae]
MHSTQSRRNGISFSSSHTPAASHLPRRQIPRPTLLLLVASRSILPSFNHGLRTFPNRPTGAPLYIRYLPTYILLLTTSCLVPIRSGPHSICCSLGLPIGPGLVRSHPPLLPLRKFGLFALVLGQE